MIEQLKKAVAILERLTKDVSLDVNASDTTRQVTYINEEIKDLFTEFSHMSFSWELDFCFEGFEEINYGELELGGECISDTFEVWLEEIEKNDLPFDLGQSIPLQEVANGDLIVLNNKGEVYYLNHEEIEDSPRLGVNLKSFYENWIELCCPGPEIWILREFYDDEKKCVSSKSEFSKKWIEVLKSS